MIEGLGPYPKYKAVRARERHIEWLRSVPDHWDALNSKWLLSPREERARPDDEQLSATQAYGVIRQKDYEERVGRKVTQIIQHLDKRRHVERDDFVISMRSFQGGLERAWAEGAIRSSYVVLKPSERIHVGYFARLFKSTDYISALQRTSNFIRDGQDLNFNNFRLVDLPVVPVAEQAAIAKFIDHADRKIRRYIRAKQKLIKLLEEQKQAIIHQAVTRGLDPNVRLKPSGVEWLGDVPEHWEVARVKMYASKISKGTTPSTEGQQILLNGPVRYLKAENLVGDSIALSPAFFISEETNEVLSRSKLAAGDVLFVIAGATLGKVAVVTDATVPANTNQAVSFIRPSRKVLPDYLAAWLRTPLIKRLTWLVAVQSAQPNLSMADLGSFPCLVPPLPEQRRILIELRGLTRVADVALERASSEISLLHEYRTRLISDVVTGKLDVRADAAALPDEVDHDEPELEEADDALDDDTDLPEEDADE